MPAPSLPPLRLPLLSPPLIEAVQTIALEPVVAISEAQGQLSDRQTKLTREAAESLLEYERWAARLQGETLTEFTRSANPMWYEQPPHTWSTLLRELLAQTAVAKQVAEQKEADRCAAEMETALAAEIDTARYRTARLIPSEMQLSGAPSETHSAPHSARCSSVDSVDIFETPRGMMGSSPEDWSNLIRDRSSLLWKQPPVVPIGPPLAPAATCGDIATELTICSGRELTKAASSRRCCCQ